jgi:hypothetical protein
MQDSALAIATLAALALFAWLYSAASVIHL